MDPMKKASLGMAFISRSGTAALDTAKQASQSARQAGSSTLQAAKGGALGQRAVTTLERACQSSLARHARIAARKAAAVKDAAVGKALEEAKRGIDWVCGEGSTDALEAMSDQMDDVFGGVFPGEESAKYPILISLAMILKQAKQDKRYSAPLASEIPFTDKTVLDRGARYAEFANAAYKRSKEAIADRISKLTAEHIHHMEVGEGVSCPSFFIAHDPVTDALVLGIRGTASVADALTDCLCEEVPFLGGRAHGAIAARAAGVVECARPLLSELLRSSPERAVIVTGHSMGGGAAVLVSLLLFSPESPQRVDHSPDRVECFAYAAPPVFAPRAAMPRAPVTYSFVHGMDCIPRMCLGSLVKLLLAVKEVDSMPLGLVERGKWLAAPACPRTPRLPDWRPCPEDMEERFQCHSPAGTLILLHRGEGGAALCEELAPEHTDRILIHPCMFRDHSMKLYEQILAELVSS